MKHTIFLSLSLWIITAFTTGYTPLTASTIPLRSYKQTTFEDKATEQACKQWVEKTMSHMSLQEKIGQLLISATPAKAEKENKKQIRELARKQKVGGLLFTGSGTPEEQAILTNLAQKSTAIPLMITFDSEWDLSMRLTDVPQFPSRAALGCISDRELLDEYNREVKRELHQLGIHACFASDADEYIKLFGPQQVTLGVNGLSITEEWKLKKNNSPSLTATEALLAGSDMLVVYRNTEKSVEEVANAIQAGIIDRAQLDERCRKVLTYKYLLGLWQPQPKLQVSGMSFRIHTDEARDLAGRLRHAAITVISNYFDILPLSPTEENVALLSIGHEGEDATFVNAIQKQIGITHFQLPWNADEAAQKKIASQLASFRRVLISVTGTSYISDRDATFLTELELQAPLIYAFFTPHHTLTLLASALAKSSAVILAHSAEADQQQQVANLLFAQATAHGKLSVNIGSLFPAGTGRPIEPGMKPSIIIPEDHGMKSYVLQQIDGIAQKGLEAGAYPGCRILILKDGHAVYDKGFGTHSDKDSTTVRPTDLFDLASLTKTTATLLAVMKLYDEGRLHLDDQASRYLPLLRNGNKKSITLRELLFHESGLPPHIRFYLDAIDPNSVHGPYSQSWEDEWHRTQVSEHSYYCSDFKFKKGLVSNQKSSVYSLHVADGLWLNNRFKQTILQKIAQCEMGSKRYVYSDLGFILLQQVVESIVQMPMDRYLEQTFYAPMGLKRTRFLPLDQYSKAEIMPTAANDFLRRQDLCGYVHDEAAACLGGVSGHAGLFSTAEEVARIYQMLLNGGECDGKRYLSEATCRLFTTAKSAISRRGLGFDRPDVSIVKRSPCAASAPEEVYGHTGFTGTCAWVDPNSQTVYVFLSNRLCPHAWNTKLGDMNIRTDIQELIFKSLK